MNLRCPLVGLLIVGACLAARAADVTEEWKSLDLLRDGDLQVRLAHKPQATLADERWLRLEFTNASKQPIRLFNAHYSIDSRTTALKTGKGISSGGLASGSLYDLFPEALDRPGQEVFLQPGTTNVVDPPSAYSAALLGLPHKDGWRIDATARLSLQLIGGREVSSPDARPSFAFDWMYPDDDGFVRMRQRLARLVAQPKGRWHEVYIRGALLRIDEISDVVSVQELLGRLDQPDGVWRSTLVQHLNRKYPRDPAVIDHYRRQLEQSRTMAIYDLARDASAVWDDSFLPLLLKRIESIKSADSELEILDRWHVRWKADPTVAPKLSAAVQASEPDIKLQPAPEWKEDRRHRWARAAEMLSQSHDARMVALLSAALDNKTVLNDLKFDAMSGPGTPPIRACDAAYNAIVHILGHDERPLHLRGFGPAAEIEKALAERDQKIHALKARLGRAADGQP